MEKDINIFDDKEASLDVEIIFNDMIITDPSLDSCSCCCTSCCCTAASSTVGVEED